MFTTVEAFLLTFAVIAIVAVGAVLKFTAWPGDMREWKHALRFGLLVLFILGLSLFMLLKLSI